MMLFHNIDTLFMADVIANWETLSIGSTYFTFRGKFYEQVEGAAMGSPISPIMANLYMDDFEIWAIQSSPNPPLLWRRFVDDTFVIMKKCHREEFLTHLNSVDKNIQFTSEEPGPEGALPFLDILIKPDQEGRLNTTVYRKPTHTDPVPSLGQSTSYFIQV